MFEILIQIIILWQLCFQINGLKVIGGGLSKTGTTSLSKALKTLGYKNHDFLEHATETLDFWEKFFGNKMRRNEWKRVYQDIDSVTDVPAAYFATELANVFPHAKVVVTIRDKESWFNSWSSHIKLSQSYFEKSFLSFFHPLIYKFTKLDKLNRKFIYGSESTNRTLYMNNYEKHYTNLKIKIPKERILFLKFGDSWEPLCKFLNKTIPKVSYPHLNGAGVLNYHMNLFYKECWLSILRWFFIINLLTFLIFKLIYSLIIKNILNFKFNK